MPEHLKEIIPWVGYFAAASGVAMFAMATMIPLRITGLVHNVASIAFGLLAGVYPTVVQHTILLPLNAWRLYQMTRLIKNVKAAVAGEHSLDWIRPFTTRRSFKAGATLVEKGTDADRMYFLVQGKLTIPEIGAELNPGVVVGELGMLSPDAKRTRTIVCAEDCELLELSYKRIEELYFQNPTFGFYFLRLASDRLFDNIARLEKELAESRAEIARLTQQAAE
jgi:CRP/FNR family cyclic AMP-dependent transcriptional regulator